MTAFKWLRTKLQYALNGQPVAPHVPKAAAEMLVAQSRANINRDALRLQQGQINAAEFGDAMKGHIKSLHIAQTALSRGGWEQMRPADYEGISATIEAQFKYLQGFASDIESGRYGRGDELAQGVLSRAALYSESGRATYENEYKTANAEAGRTEAKRILASVKNCDGCIEEADKDWQPIDEIADIGSLDCKSACHCILIFR